MRVKVRVGLGLGFRFLELPKQNDALVGRGYSALGRPEPKEEAALLGIRGPSMTGRSKTVEGPVLFSAVLVKVIEELREAT